MKQIFIDLLPYVAILAACTCAVVTDLRSRTIPNAIPITLITCALIYQACHGVIPFAIAVGCAFAVLLVGSFLFQLGWMGGGDVKLIAAGCAFLSLPEIGFFLITTVFGGALLALATAAATRTLRSSLSNTFMMMHGATVSPKIRIAPHSQAKMPYAIAIAFGAVSLTFTHLTNSPGLRIF